MTTFVSGYFDLNESRPLDKNIDTHFQNFEKILQIGVNVHCFISVCYKDRIQALQQQYKTLEVSYLEFADLELCRQFEGIDIDLPRIRNIPHDTRNFLLLMNAKTELVKLAIEKNIFRSSHFAWIDFGIFHVVKNVPVAKALLKGISQATLQDHSILVIPGCNAKKPVRDTMFNSVIWRFAGGFFFGDSSSIMNFCTQCERLQNRELVKQKRMTWEVNVWAKLEEENVMPILWYSSGHDESMFNIPTYLFSSIPFTRQGCIRQPSSLIRYWDGPYSRCHAGGPIEIFIKNYIENMNLPLSVLFTMSDGFVGSREYPFVEKTPQKGVTLTGPNEAQRIEGYAHVGTYPVIATLCTRGYDRPNTLLCPLDDEVFSQGLGKILTAGAAIPWESRIPKAVWRGGSSGYERPSVRMRLVSALESFPNTDVKFTRGGWPENDAPIPHNHFGDRYTVEQQMRYKYIFIVDGACIASNHQWVFGSGAVPLMLTHPNNRFWFQKELKSMENYVPIAYDLSDLEEKLNWLMANDYKARLIAERARELATRIFTPEFQQAYLASELQRIVKARYNYNGLQQTYIQKVYKSSDINEHLPILRELAQNCSTIVECGVQNHVSSYAFAVGLLGKPANRLIMVDPYRSSEMIPFVMTCKQEGVNAEFWCMSDLECPQIDADMVFIDTWHIYGQLKRELEVWQPHARRYIVMHDTTVDEWDGESIRGHFNAESQSKSSGFPVEEIRKGLWPAIEEFLAAHPEWRLERRYVNNNGLTILERIN